MGLSFARGASKWGSAGGRLELHWFFVDCFTVPASYDGNGRNLLRHRPPGILRMELQLSMGCSFRISKYMGRIFFM